MKRILDREISTKKKSSWIFVLLLNSILVIVSFIAYKFQTQVKDSFFFMLGEIIFLAIINSVIASIIFLFYHTFYCKKWLIMSFLYVVIFVGLMLNAYIFINYLI
jgi:hypothetical protein